MRQAKAVFVAPDLATRYLVLGTLPLAKCSLQFKILLRAQEGWSAHGSGLAKTLEASAARAARLQIRSILLSMVAQPVCASGERCNCFLRRICTLCVLCGDNTTNGGAQIGKNGIFRVLLAGDDKSGGGWIIELGRRPKEKPPAAGRCRRWRGW